MKKKSVGPDGIKNFLLKMSLPYITESLTHIYNLCIINQVFPDKWKKAKVIPLPKVKNPLMLIISDPFRYYRFFQSHLKNMFTNT